MSKISGYIGGLNTSRQANQPIKRTYVERANDSRYHFLSLTQEEVTEKINSCMKRLAELREKAPKLPCRASSITVRGSARKKEEDCGKRNYGYNSQRGVS